MASQGFASRLTQASLHGALLGTWWGLCAIATIFAAERGWGIVAIDPPLIPHVMPVGPAIDLLLARSGWSIAPGAWALLPVFIAIGAALGASAASLGHLLRLDPDRLSLLALRSVAARRTQLAAWLAPGLLMAFVAIAFPGLADRTVLWVLALLVALPFLVLHPDVTGPGMRSWRMDWPGFAPLATAFALGVAWMVSTIVLRFLAGLGPRSLLVANEIVGTAVAIVATLLFVSTWLDRRTPASLWTHRKTLARWSLLGPMAALQVRLLVLYAWLAPPVLAIALTAIWVWPQLLEFARQANRAAPDPAWLAHLRVVAAQGGLLVPAVLAPLSLVAIARLYRLVQQESGKRVH